MFGSSQVKAKEEERGDSSVHTGPNPETTEPLELQYRGCIYPPVTQTHPRARVQVQPSAPPLLFRRCFREWSDAEGLDSAEIPL